MRAFRKLEERLSVGKSSLKCKETGIGKTDLYSFKFIKNNDSNFLVWVKCPYLKRLRVLILTEEMHYVR